MLLLVNQASKQLNICTALHASHASSVSSSQNASQGWANKDSVADAATDTERVAVTILLLLHGSGRSHEHPLKEPNVAHGVNT
jgi:hypothetical protein